jgi:hypothetical protein
MFILFHKQRRHSSPSPWLERHRIADIRYDHNDHRTNEGPCCHLGPELQPKLAAPRSPWEALSLTIDPLTKKQSCRLGHQRRSWRGSRDCRGKCKGRSNNAGAAPSTKPHNLGLGHKSSIVWTVYVPLLMIDSEVSWASKSSFVAPPGFSLSYRSSLS